LIPSSTMQIKKKVCIYGWCRLSTILHLVPWAGTCASYVPSWYGAYE
jgi:hypothetical protein